MHQEWRVVDPWEKNRTTARVKHNKEHVHPRFVSPGHSDTSALDYQPDLGKAQLGWRDEVRYRPRKTILRK
jgi:hypothetical protein